MNPFSEIYKRMCARGTPPNAFLMGAADRVPCRIVIENPTDFQTVNAIHLATEFDLECLVGHDDLVITRPDEEECAFYQL